MWKILPVKYFFLAAISGHMDLGAPGVSGVEDLRSEFKYIKK